MHMIHPVSCFIAPLLGLFEQTTAFEEFLAYELIGVLIAVTLPTGIGVAVWLYEIPSMRKRIS